MALRWYAYSNALYLLTQQLTHTHQNLFGLHARTNAATLLETPESASTLTLPHHHHSGERRWVRLARTALVETSSRGWSRTESPPRYSRLRSYTHAAFSSCRFHCYNDSPTIKLPSHVPWRGGSLRY